VRNVFDAKALAERWRPFSEGYESKVFSVTTFDEKRRRIVREITPGIVVDAGCGPLGLVLRDLAHLPETQACGLDVCDAMVLQSQAATDDLPIQYVVGDLRCLPFMDSSVDAVVAINSLILETRAECRLAFREIGRILRGRGRLVALLPSFEMSLVTRDRWKMRVRLDQRNRREWDTTGWQCFYTEFDIQEAIRQSRGRVRHIERVEFSAPEEIKQLRSVYSGRLQEIPTSRLLNDPLCEHLLVADF
jgi:SAM-dependent methyltransferase